MAYSSAHWNHNLLAWSNCWPGLTTFGPLLWYIPRVGAGRVYGTGSLASPLPIGLEHPMFVLSGLLQTVCRPARPLVPPSRNEPGFFLFKNIADRPRPPYTPGVWPSAWLRLPTPSGTGPGSFLIEHLVDRPRSTYTPAAYRRPAQPPAPPRGTEPGFFFDRTSC